MKRKFVVLSLTACIVMLLCACKNTEPEVSHIDPVSNQSSIAESSVLSEESESSVDDSIEESSVVQSSLDVSFVDEESEMKYDDSLYSENIVTIQRVNDRINKIGMKAFTEVSPGKYEYKDDDFDLTCETDLYVIKHFLYNVKTKDFSESNVKKAVDKLCEFLNAAYPDAIDDAQKKEIIDLCVSAAKSDDPGLYDIVFQYKDEEDIWFNFGVNTTNNTIGIFNPKY